MEQWACDSCETRFCDVEELSLHVALHEEEERDSKRTKVRASDDGSGVGQHHKSAEYRVLSCPRCGAGVAGDEELALHLQYEHDSPHKAAPAAARTAGRTEATAVVAVASEKPAEEGSWVLLSDVRKRAGEAVTGRTVWCEAEGTRLFRGSEKWGSCGYRNTQSLLSAAGVAVPAVAGVQQLVCAAWREGFDAKSARQLGGDRLLGSQTWIGACECVSVLRAVGRRAYVYEFERSAKAFDLRPMAVFFGEWFGRVGAAPLMVQWKGHSVLAVGVAKGGEGAAVWDPNEGRLRERAWSFFDKRGTLHVVALTRAEEDDREGSKDMGYMARRAII